MFTSCLQASTVFFLTRLEIVMKYYFHFLCTGNGTFQIQSDDAAACADGVVCKSCPPRNQPERPCRAGEAKQPGPVTVALAQQRVSVLRATSLADAGCARCAPRAHTSYSSAASLGGVILRDHDGTWATVDQRSPCHTSLYFPGWGRRAER